MEFIVMLSSGYVRDMQTHMAPLAEEDMDRLHDDECGWKDYNESVYIATVQGVENTDAAIRKVADDYNCPPDRFWAVQVVSEK